MMPVGQTSTVAVGNEERGTAYTGRKRWWKVWGGCHDGDCNAYATFMGTPCVHSFEEADYKVKLSEVIDHLREESLVSLEPSLSLWCGSGKLSYG